MRPKINSISSCPKCGYEMAGEMLPWEMTYRSILQMDGVIDEWIECECCRCKFIWEEACKEPKNINSTEEE